MTAPLPPAPLAPSPAEPISWTDPKRAEVFRGWLEGIAPAHRLLPDTVRLASVDASFRRYFRLDTTDPAAPTRIVMDAPPDKENSDPFVQVAKLMAEAGVLAPAVLEWDRPHGFLLLDDLGRQTMLDVLDPARPDASRPLYDEAIDALIRWQLASKPGVLPPYDRALLERELALFPEWYIGRHRGIAVEGKLKERLDRSFKLIVDSNLASPSVYVHRDFMPRNLMIGSGPKLGVLDFQDAVYGPITYDIASLMRDAFLSWDEEFVLDITIRYWVAARKAGLPVDEDFGAFYRAVEWMGLQRHLKVAGIFARITLRDGKPRYLADTPRFIAYIRATAGRYMELTPLVRVIDEIEGTSAITGFAYGRV
ncbi:MULTISPECIES: aminoglycoside phosphotransferase family protein [Variovorax]|jgi:N-acetylmuramate 1-kinase|uniref:aminoglycoside phosphotransferase family protein n=1 Tax=Variovorax TaxID=34072 RepID=UPI000868B6F3|nr:MULTISPECIES: phosphotransferase [Variovorax]MBN8755213.1 phosphotransferase [Variovorax sp.]ODU16029.1 MAG: aminoglycoside phosphotransferase [Variovorax sp. SCN 67-85]ODV22279.1 MAG: aminoglycoside phosphotransferase [Variovorax sp. SCN 67-20]OJZ14228.1 MAG: aminoglycoside phosphotransferase [Variovorax sp. 67-131]UKI08759.1 phosphotransferase [Variovorax paradoxus]